MKMLRMGGKMGEMGEMGMGERKSIGSFCMRVGIFVSMYFTFPFLIPPKRSFLQKNSFFKYYSTN